MTAFYDSGFCLYRNKWTVNRADFTALGAVAAGRREIVTSRTLSAGGGRSSPALESRIEDIAGDHKTRAEQAQHRLAARVFISTN